jgi:hypothetical protein
VGHGVPSYTNASLLIIGALLAQNIIGKNDQTLMYASRLFNSVEHIILP